MTNTPPPDSRAEVWLEGHVLHQRRGALSGSVVLTPDMATWLAALLQELDAAEDFAVKAFQERDNWRTFARSRKDKVLIDTITSLEAHLEVAQAAVLHEERRAEAAESARKDAEARLREVEADRDRLRRLAEAWKLCAAGAIKRAYPGLSDEQIRALLLVEAPQALEQSPTQEGS